MEKSERNWEKEVYLKSEKETLRKELSGYNPLEVSRLFGRLTGRPDLETANLFCLALMCNILKKAEAKRDVKKTFANSQIFA